MYCHAIMKMQMQLRCAGASVHRTLTHTETADHCPLRLLTLLLRKLTL